MSNRLGGLLLALPIMISSAHMSSAYAAAPASDNANVQTPVVAAPAGDQTAMPAGCAGCVGHDCANCPLLQAAASATAGAPSKDAETPCK